MDAPACAYNDISWLLTLTHSWSLSGYLVAGFSLRRSHGMRPNLNKLLPFFLSFPSHEMDLLITQTHPMENVFERGKGSK